MYVVLCAVRKGLANGCYASTLHNLQQLLSAVFCCSGVLLPAHNLSEAVTYPRRPLLADQALQCCCVGYCAAAAAVLG
jgi:hypothetical protein